MIDQATWQDLNNTPGNEPIPTTPLQLTEHLISNCTKCPLHRTRTCAVPGEGPPDARIVMIGEAPGRNEDAQGRPFVGAAGKLLDELLPTAGLQRSDVYITNVLKCRPPANRDPLPEEIATCAPHLNTQLRLIQPELIITLGAFSLNHYFPKETVGKARGQLRNCGGTYIYPVMHPAAALRRREFRDHVTADFQNIPNALAQLRSNPPEPERPTQPPPLPNHNQAQTSLF